MDLEKEIIVIQERNRRVEGDKAWETSLVRRLSIAAFTFIFAALWLWSIGNSQPLLNALIPPVGYLLSMLTLPVVKSWWLGKRR